MKKTPTDKEKPALKQKSRSRFSSTVRGVVKLADWADEESPLDLVIITSEGEEVLVVNQRDSISPEGLVDCLVEGSGTVAVRDGQKTIALRRVKAVESLPSGGEMEIDEVEEQIRFEIAVEDEMISEYSRHATGSEGVES